MQPKAKHWQIALPPPPDVEASLQNYPPLLRQILHNRGYHSAAEARAFLEARPPDGDEAENLLGMAAAVDRILFAIRKDEIIAIYGDYDADGVTATALLTLFLRAMGGKARPYIPNRFDEGYGLNNEALDILKEEGVQLVITVDCGIRSPDEAQHAQELGLDLIITDHHHPGPELPAAVAVINPKQAGDSYPDKNLAGVGLAFKLAQALAHRDQNLAAKAIPDDYLDLVALGTIADMAPLVGENRSLVRKGLRSIRSPSRQGIFSLINVARLNAATISATDVGFMLGPRLNAAGRLDSALAALELLTSQDVQKIGTLAQILDNQNRERQQVTREIQADAEQRALEDDPDALLLFAASPDYNPGVVGLAASRLTELYYRPAIVAYKGEEFTRASCRSIPEFHITEALDECAGLLIHHGGHSAAAGFTVRTADLVELIQRLNLQARARLGGLGDLRPTLHADAQTELSDMHPDLLKVLEQLEPTGFGNPQALFVTKNLRVARSRTVGKDASHLKLTVTDGKIFIDAIAFRFGQLAAQMQDRIDLLYSFEMNEFNGQRSLQLRVRDIKPSNQTA